MTCEGVELPATSPEIWGPPTWTALHLLAAGYPPSPTPPVRRSCRAFLEALPWMLPCEACGYHFRQFLLGWPGGSGKAASCRDALQCFLVDAHNAVAAHTRPDARPWTHAEARAFYETGCRTEASPPPRLWSGAAHLVRNRGRVRAAPGPTCSCSSPASPDER
jgi:hypothetical protein